MPADITEALVNPVQAKLFLEQACIAYAAGDQKTFEVARALVAINLGLSTEKLKS